MRRSSIGILLVFSAVFLASISVQIMDVVKRTRLSDIMRPQGVVDDFISNAGPAKGVLILTNYRSGSTFFGELFNQHADTYYTYEPLLPLERYNDTQALRVLESIFTCQIQDVAEYMDRDRSKALVLANCIRDNVCFRTKIKQFCTPKYCVHPQSCTRCKRLTSSDMSQKCRSKKFSVAKVIRLQNLRSLRTLVEKLELKILHLVRDPRGILSSRRNIHPEFETMTDTCNKLLRNTKLGLLESHPWLEGRYKLLRYEDVAISPMEMAEDVYDFVGLNMTKEIRRWIEISTKGDVGRSTDIRTAKLKAMRMRRQGHRQLPKNKFDKLILSDAYSTVRHSNATWQAWRHSLKPFDIQAVQQDCEEVMKLLGYNLLPGGKDDSTIDVLAPLPSFDGKALNTLENVEVYS